MDNYNLTVKTGEILGVVDLWYHLMDVHMPFEIREELRKIYNDLYDKKWKERKELEIQ